jgi:polar amino acid transport system substrate-binding protein
MIGHMKRAIVSLFPVLVLSLNSAAADTVGLRLLYVGDAAPFSAAGVGGTPEGYAVTLCERVAAVVTPGAAPSWQQIGIAEGLDRLARGEADLLCGPVSDTVAREQHADFSSPIAIGGIGAVLRPGAPAWLLRLLRIGDATLVPPKAQLASLDWPRRLAVLRGGSATEWLTTLLAREQVDVVAVQVADYDEASRRLADGDVGGWVGEWAVLLQHVKSDARLSNMVLIPRPIVGEPLAIAVRPDPVLSRGVRAALAGILRGSEFSGLTERWFGSVARAQVSLIRSVTPRIETMP